MSHLERRIEKCLRIKFAKRVIKLNSCTDASSHTAYVSTRFQLVECASELTHSLKFDINVIGTDFERCFLHHPFLME